VRKTSFKIILPKFKSSFFIFRPPEFFLYLLSYFGLVQVLLFAWRQL
jgi:hypothetical protein